MEKAQYGLGNCHLLGFREPSQRKIIKGNIMTHNCIIIVVIFITSNWCLSTVFSQDLINDSLLQLDTKTEFDSINDSLLQLDTKTEFDSTPVEGGPFGTFIIIASFENISENNLAELAFVVARLTGDNLLLNADDDSVNNGSTANNDRGIGGAGSILTVPLDGDYSDGILTSGESFTVKFLIGLASLNSFEFFVDALGTTLSIFLPAVDPVAITLGVSTAVTVGARIAISNPSLIPSSVNLVEVDESGMELVILAALSDRGTNGDVLPGDNIFGGEFPFQSSSIGITRLAVSVSFPEISGKASSEISILEVFPPGVPTDIKPSDMTQVVIDPKTLEEIICNEVTVFFESGTDINTIKQ